jgi:hypothetical protein
LSKNSNKITLLTLKTFLTMEQAIRDAMKSSIRSIVAGALVEGQNNPLSQAARRLSLTEGQVVHFGHVIDPATGASTLKPDHVQNADGTKGNAYFGYDTAEEILVTTSQLCRRGNGLKLQGSTTEEMLFDFCEKVEQSWEDHKDQSEYKGPALKVVELKTRPGRNGLQVIPMWQPTW